MHAFCKDVEISMLKKTQTAKGKEPARTVRNKAPLTQTSKERLVATVHQQRVVVKDLEGRISELETDIEKNSITINESLEKDFLEIFANSSSDITPHMKVFWEQQRKLIASPKFGRRYHPHVI